MAANFPKDPFADVTVLTATSKFELVLAYLALDSLYFEKVDPDTKEIDLTHLLEEPLVRVLKSLYGYTLTATSATDLQELYRIIHQLEITDYKVNIIDTLSQSAKQCFETSHLNSIQMIEFCLNNQILEAEIESYHFKNQLTILESSKNYLKLNKLSENNLNRLLINFYEDQGQKVEKIINNILENYFNRKSHKAHAYLKNENVTPLRKIWEKYHHKLPTDPNPYEKKYSDQRDLKSAQTQGDSDNEAQELDRKIINMEISLAKKDQQIAQLRAEIAKIKEKKNGIHIELESQEEEFSDSSLLHSVKNSKKQKTKEAFDLNQSGVDEPAFDRAKLKSKEQKVNRFKNENKKIFP